MKTMTMSYCRQLFHICKYLCRVSLKGWLLVGFLLLWKVIVNAKFKERNEITLMIMMVIAKIPAANLFLASENLHNLCCWIFFHWIFPSKIASNSNNQTNMLARLLSNWVSRAAPTGHMRSDARICDRS